ncbi:MAG: MFS transporter [Methylobacteriaceae bacterium]|nr:MFS transporter [Methylobacteriaceae bacterium]MBV9394374.1 MFS transporter [Methylobacteriaceae bacterium]
MDGFDFLILGFMMSAIARDLGLGATAGASLATFTLIGAVIGGFVFGLLADAYGRVRVLSLTILIFALFTGLSAFAQGYWDLVAYRTIAGLGLGGEFGIGMALVAEAWPASQRARASSYVGLGWQAGVLAAALITPVLLPLIGWRGMFLVGLVPALASFFIRRSVGEPELFVRKKPTGFPIKLLAKDAATAKISLGMFILCSVQNFGYYGLMIWMPNYLSKQFGFSLTQSALWTAVTILGMAFGIWLFGELADRIGRRPVFIFYQVGAFVMVLVYSQLTNPTALLVGGAIMGLFVNGMLGGYGALMSELYPTNARATAQNVLFNLGRGVGGFGPVVIASLAGAYSFSAAIALLALIYLIDIAATYFLIPERKGMALE